MPHGKLFFNPEKVRLYRTDLQQEILHKQKNYSSKNLQTYQKTPTTEKKTYVEKVGYHMRDAKGIL